MYRYASYWFCFSGEPGGGGVAGGGAGSSDWVHPGLPLTFLLGTETLGKKHPLSGPPSLISKVLLLPALTLRTPHIQSISQKPPKTTQRSRSHNTILTSLQATSRKYTWLWSSSVNSIQEATLNSHPMLSRLNFKAGDREVSRCVHGAWQRRLLGPAPP